MPEDKINRTVQNKILVVGGSSGSPSALIRILSDLPDDFQLPVLVVLHMPEGFVEKYAERADSKVNIDFKLGEEGDTLSANSGFIAPAGKHMIIKEKNSSEIITLKEGDYVNYVKPSIDVLLKSVVNVYDGGVIGVLLSGMGEDGAEGLELVREQGGWTIVQNEDTSAVFGIQKAAIKRGAVDIVTPLNKISSKIMNEVRQ